MVTPNPSIVVEETKVMCRPPFDPDAGDTVVTDSRLRKALEVAQHRAERREIRQVVTSFALGHGCQVWLVQDIR